MARCSHKSPLVIIEDTREQTPLTEWPSWVQVERATLHTGDYSILGWEESFTIERKSLADLITTMLTGYEASSERPKRRFNRVLERMRHFDCRAVVVTATPEQVLAARFHCGKPAGAALWGFAMSIFTTYGVPVLFLGPESLAAKWIADCARHFVAMRTKKNFARADLSEREADRWLDF